MKKTLLSLGLLVTAITATYAQHVEFEEYDLSNGLHVILHQDKSAPVVATSVMYHVGAKDETPDRTGFAHFFEHLLFEGTQNIGRGQWDKIVSSNGGQSNANTTDDRTYYYEIFPSNNLELAIWMESERMLHPVINQIGVDTQREVVKEEKRMRYENVPYGQLLLAVKNNLFEKHPYRWQTIGSIEHLNAATLDEFIAFHDKFYIPNNAVLVIAGDFDKAQAKKWIEMYFGSIPKGTDVVKTKYEETPITKQRNAVFEDPNIQLPMLLTAYRTPSMKDRDAYVLEMIASVLSGGKSSRLYKKLVDDEKIALEVGSFNFSQEDYSTYFILGIPMSGKTNEEMLASIDEEVKKIQTELISEEDYQKLQNQFENEFINQNSTVENVASSLASYYMLYKDVNLINKVLDIYRSITREEIRDVANKYLNNNQRLVLDYVPAATTAQE
ncbi:insulinase family protein [Dysgonomonas sp. 216]|uniref:M16 family metallopeptidase n=1 Tax=Dysgonomonas sp. 216 TaxID=2302934 RepID=UPI0013D3BEF0|nr:pitrilysin family protein [Dysgonomonas sp. 216]NDW19522.1 insulinase family protein [Dysgonomonas sp. 216]